MRPVPDRPGPGQESVWDYPRPPRLVPSDRRVRIVLGGVTIAETTGAIRILETSHPPTWYLPPDAFRPGSLVPAAGSSVCEWKGRAVYLDVVGGGVTAARAGWSYPRPLDPYGALAGFVAVYAGRMDACMVGDEKVRPQPGGFYGGWITDDVAGPFKGEPGTLHW
jgi:uncharacterized protein (DUF427 family)